MLHSNLVDRMVPVGERALDWADKYITDIRPGFVVEPDGGVLFLSSEGQMFTANHLSHLVREYIKDTDIGKTDSCHLLRHTMATLMLEGGVDIRFIQEMLGHANLETTQIYTQVSIRKLQEIHADYVSSPKAGARFRCNRQSSRPPISSVWAKLCSGSACAPQRPLPARSRKKPILSFSR